MATDPCRGAAAETASSAAVEDPVPDTCAGEACAEVVGAAIEEDCGVDPETAAAGEGAESPSFLVPDRDGIKAGPIGLKAPAVSPEFSAQSCKLSGRLVEASVACSCTVVPPVC